MLSMRIVNEFVNTTSLISLHTLALTVISLLLIKVSPSNFPDMLIEASSFVLFKYLNFDFYTLKVPFIRSWPIYIMLKSYRT